MMSNQSPNNKIVTVNTPKNLSLSREVPMNLGAEQALLGAIISNNLAFEKIENLTAIFSSSLGTATEYLRLPCPHKMGFQNGRFRSKQRRAQF